jgi:hypothetical protein
MKKTFYALAALTMTLLVSGCDVRVTKVDADIIESAKSNMAYFKDDYGLCYAMVQSGMAGHSNSGVGLTHIPCEKVGL